jgi:hypothetical protein
LEFETDIGSIKTSLKTLAHANWIFFRALEALIQLVPRHLLPQGEGKPLEPDV